jgi:hypothetical protein
MKRTLLYLFLLFSTTLFSQISTNYEPYNVCDNNNDGFATFNLTSKIPEILGNLSPNDYSVSFYQSMTNAMANVNAFVNPSNYTNVTSNIQTIYIGITNLSNNEISVASMNLVVNSTPVISIPTVTACYEQGIAGFDLGSVAEGIWAQNGSASNFINIDFYLTQSDAANQVNPIGYYFQTQSQVTTIFVYATNTVTGCSALAPLVLIAEDCGGNTCIPPTNGNVSAITATTATVSWTETSTAFTFEYIVLPQASAAPTPTTAGTILEGIYQTVVSGLTANTCYTFYIRSVCSATETSAWTTGSTFCTLTNSPACGGTFIDNGGTNGDYLNNTNETTTICPTNSGDVVTVTFTAFNTEANWDGLYVHNGNSTSAALIPSTNGAGTNSALNIAGAFWGTTIPGPFTSSATDGCLTFRFLSDNTVVRSGWVANVTCAPPPTCLPITQVTTSAVLTTSAVVSWNNPNTATNFEVLLLPQGSPTPTASATGFLTTTSNPYTIIGLQSSTCYTVYVRARCEDNDAGVWSAGSTFCTQTAPPECGGMFIDNGGATGNYTNNADETTTICPTITGQQVTVTFASFDVEATWDALYVYDGNSINAPQIASTNTGGNVPGNLPGGYWGTTIPGPFTSTSVDGCLTFRFRSDNTQVRAGWVANITCGSVDRVVLHAFIDTNNNGIKDSGEVNFNHGSFVYDTNNSGTNTEAYSPDGYYIITDDNGTDSYDISYQIQSEYADYFSAGATVYTDVTIPALSGTQNLYFPITVTQTYTDVAVTIIPINAPRAGITNYRNEVVVTNLGNETIASTTLTFTKDSNLTVVNVSDAGATITPTGFTRIFTNLLPNESRSIIINMSVPTIPTVSIGQVLTNMASVTPPTNDLIANNNTTTLSQPIVAAYDPNDKIESHGGRIQYDSFTVNDFLFYTIRFENTGNISAIDVKVTDILDNKIDETSVRMLSASHNYVMTRTGSNLVWDFKEIQLPVSIPNTQLGKGFITFKAKLKPGFAIGDIIPNTASIFFDTNPAIVTNTFNTEFVQQLSTTTFTDKNIVVYPNPASTLVNVSLNNSSETISSVSIYDLLGKKVIDNNAINSNQVIINTSSLSKGVYLIEITSDSTIKLIKKLIIQ